MTQGEYAAVMGSNRSYFRNGIGSNHGGTGNTITEEVLKPEEFEMFRRLREWRKAVAEKEGLPVYVMLSNEQLASMVRGRISSKAQLKEVKNGVPASERGQF